MRTISQIKQAALDNLSHNWASSVGVTAISMGISYGARIVLLMIWYFAYVFLIFGSISTQAQSRGFSALLIGMATAVLVLYFVGNIASSMLTSNLTIGKYVYHTNLANGTQAAVSDVFVPLRKHFFKSFFVYFLMELKALLWALPLYIPGAFLAITGPFVSKGIITFPPYIIDSVPPDSTAQVVTGTIMSAIGFILIIISLIPFIIAQYRYKLAPIIFAENPSVGVYGAIRKSKKLMKGNKARAFLLELSFIGWGILCLFTFNIGNLFLIPYITSAECVFYNDILGKPVANNRIAHQQNFPAGNIPGGNNIGGAGNP